MMRTFKDADGRSWRVWQVVPQSDILKSTSPELADGWLCFERDGEKRRLLGPPDGWHAVPDAELLAMLGRATVVKQLGARQPR
jgi:hypothetical protein